MTLKREEKSRMVPLGQANIERELIDAQVVRLGYSPALITEGNAKKILEYLVEPSLEGERIGPQELAIKALGRQHYDPGDSHVRNAADKLRRGLKAHYASRDAKPGEIVIDLPKREYMLYTPSARDAVSAVFKAFGRMQAKILEPEENACVNARIVVRGRIDSLHPDLRPWLVVLAPDGLYHPQCRISRHAPTWKADVSIGRMAWGDDNGSKFEILLIAAHYDGDYVLHSYQKGQGDSFGTSLPADVEILDTRPVFRSDKGLRRDVLLYNLGYIAGKFHPRYCSLYVRGEFVHRMDEGLERLLCEELEKPISRNGNRSDFEPNERGFSLCAIYDTSLDPKWSQFARKCPQYDVRSILAVGLWEEGKQVVRIQLINCEGNISAEAADSLSILLFMCEYIAIGAKLGSMYLNEGV